MENSLDLTVKENQIQDPIQIKKEENVLLDQQQMKHAEMKKNSNSSPDHNESLKKESKDLLELGIPETLIEQISILSSDMNKASKYFSPVVECSIKLTKNKYSSIREAAKDIGELMGHIFYYLDNRGATLFSGQRKARRNVCNNVLTEVGKYLPCAGLEFKQEIQAKVYFAKAVEMPEKDGNAAVEVFHRAYGYTISNESINGEVAKKTFAGLSREQIAKDETKSLSKIRLSLEGLNAMLTNKMPPAPAANASDDVKSAYGSEIMAVGYGITKMYRAIIDSCRNYIDSKDADLKLVEHAQALIAGCEHDAKFFANGISEYIAGHKGSDVVTWGDAIAQKGSMRIQLADKGVKKMGAATSVVYRYQKDNKNKYFKEEEKVSGNPEETLKSIQGKIEKMPGYNESYKAKIKELISKMEEQLKPVLNVSYGKEYKKNQGDPVYSLYKNFIVPIILSNGDPIKAARLMKAKKYPFLKYLAELKGDKEYTKLVNSIVTDFAKQFNSDYLAVRSVKIKPGSTLSNRNVATSRMADLLGISHMVMKSETQEVQNGKDTITGNVMEEAPGEEAAKALFDKRKYTPEVINQIVIMQVFDLICGQVDRNARNYYIKTNSDNKISSIFMLDNDMSFGNLTGVIGTGKIQRMVKMNPLTIEVLPPEMKSAIKRLNACSEADLGFVFGDILSKDEISSLKTRISEISNAIEKSEKNQKNKKDPKIEELMKDPRFRAIKYQYALYEKIINPILDKEEDLLSENELKDKIFSRMLGVTYLNTENMMPYETVKKEYEKYIKN